MWQNAIIKKIYFFLRKRGGIYNIKVRDLVNVFAHTHITYIVPDRKPNKFGSAALAFRAAPGSQQ